MKLKQNTDSNVLLQDLEKVQLRKNFPPKDQKGIRTTFTLDAHIWDMLERITEEYSITQKAAIDYSTSLLLEIHDSLNLSNLISQHSAKDSSKVRRTVVLSQKNLDSLKLLIDAVHKRYPGISVSRDDILALSIRIYVAADKLNRKELCDSYKQMLSILEDLSIHASKLYDSKGIPGDDRAWIGVARIQNTIDAVIDEITEAAKAISEGHD